MHRVALLIATALSAGVAAGAESSLDAADREASRLITVTRATAARPRGPKIIPRFQQKSFTPPVDGSCGIKSFTLLDYETRSIDGPEESARITVMGAVTETTDPSCARDFGVVQFIRGCVYHARYSLETGAELERTFDVARHLRGPRVVFSHPDFEVDNTELDPLYASYPEETDRQALVYVPTIPLRLRPDAKSMLADLPAFNDPARRDFLKDATVPSATTFIADVPEGGVSGVQDGAPVITATNSSLDFKTCVYRLKDIPLSGDPARFDVPSSRGGPLQCFAWSSRYTYDPTIKDFVTDRFSGVDPFCAQAPARVPLPGN